ncbi:flagellar assembly protein A [Nautilia sp.]
MGLFDFLKKEQKTSKKSERDVLPLVIRTENVNEALLRISADNNIPLSSLDFEILDFRTFIKTGNSEFVELDERGKELIHMEDFLINDANEIKQVYDIEVKKMEYTDDLELIGEIKINKFFTKAEYILKPESLIVYKPGLEKKIKNELNKKKIRNSMLIKIFDEQMNKDIEKIVAKIRVLGSLENEENIILCKGIDPVENIEGKIIFHFMKKKESIKNELLFPVKKDDVLIEIIKPLQGRNGRDCRGNIITVPKVKEFTVPNISVNPAEIKKEENERRIVFTALKDGYIYNDGGVYTIKDEMEIKQINLKTGDVHGAKESNVKLEVKENDALKEAIADNMIVETTVLIVRGNVGNSAKINARDLTIEGQTHKKAVINAEKAFVNIHKGYIEGKYVEINRLEGGTVKAKKAVIKQAIGGKVVAEEIEFNILGSHTEAYGLKSIIIKTLKGSENRLIISPLEVLGLNADADKLEKRIREIKRNIEIKTELFNKRKRVVIKNRPTVEKLMQTFIDNKKKGIKTSPVILKKIKEFSEFRDKTLELKNEIFLLKKDLEEVEETLKNFQTAVFNAKIISRSPWTPFNRIEFDMAQPPVRLTYDTKGDEGICGFKLKDYGERYKIVKIKVKDDSGTEG